MAMYIANSQKRTQEPMQNTGRLRVTGYRCVVLEARGRSRVNVELRKEGDG